MHHPGRAGSGARRNEGVGQSSGCPGPVTRGRASAGERLLGLQRTHGLEVAEDGGQLVGGPRLAAVATVLAVADQAQRARAVVLGDGEVAGDRVRPYVKYASRGNTIAIAFNDGHPRNEGRNSVHVALYRRGRFYRADGTRIGTLGKPLDPRRADVVYQARGHRRPRAWLQDVALNAQGNPVVVYAIFPRKRSHRYRYAIFSHGRWHDRPLVRAGGAKRQRRLPSGRTA